MTKSGLTTDARQKIRDVNVHNASLQVLTTYLNSTLWSMEEGSSVSRAQDLRLRSRLPARSIVNGGLCLSAANDAWTST